MHMAPAEGEPGTEALARPELNDACDETKAENVNEQVPGSSEPVEYGNIAPMMPPGSGAMPYSLQRRLR